MVKPFFLGVTFFPQRANVRTSAGKRKIDWRHAPINRNNALHQTASRGCLAPTFDMASRSLARMDIDSDVIAKLAARRITTAEALLSLSRLDLLEILEGQCVSDIDEVVRVVSESVAGASVTVYEMWKAHGVRCVPTLLKDLDQALEGGVPCGSVTELVGPGGIGKTHFCLVLSLVVAAGLTSDNQERPVIYIDTEKKFSSPRMEEILRHRLSSIGHRNIDKKVSAALKKILLVTPNDAEEVLDQLKDLESNVIDHGAGLVVLDSVAALVRAQYSRDQIFDRQEMIGQQATKLKILAETFNIPVVVTNQVMANFGQRGAPGQETVSAALGTKWAHAVNTRLVLERSGDDRYIKITKSPSCPNHAAAYKIGQGGIEPDPHAPVLQDAAGTILDAGITNQIDYDFSGLV